MEDVEFGAIVFEYDGDDPAMNNGSELVDPVEYINNNNSDELISLLSYIGTESENEYNKSLSSDEADSDMEIVSSSDNEVNEQFIPNT